MRLRVGVDFEPTHAHSNGKFPARNIQLPTEDQSPDAERAQRLNLLTHDIRNAVFDVIGGLRQVDHGRLDPETHLQLERIRTSGEVLSRLVEDALQLVEEGLPGTEAVFANLHLHRLLRDTEFRWGGRAHEKGIEFGLVVGADVPAVISTDRMGLERILSNLLSNALKYSDNGRVELRVNLEDNNILAFRVSDSGPGFSQTALSRLFSEGGRPENARPGSGLGLHIAKQLADRMGATIDIGSVTNGARVSLLLPARAWHYATATAESQEELPDLSDIRVLVAEDNETNQLIIAQMLEIMGAEYEIAQDGVEALHWLERERFDIALIDIDMPRLSGLEVMRQIRAQKDELARLPILAVTAFVLRANRDAIFEAGGDRILTKPILSLESFGRAIAALLNLTGVKTAPSHLSHQAIGINEDQFSHLLNIAGPEGRATLLNRLLTDLTRVSDQLATALTRFDKSDLRAQSHVLISLAGAVGAQELQSKAEALNAAAHHDDREAVAALGQETDRLLAALLERIEREPGTAVEDIE